MAKRRSQDSQGLIYRALQQGLNILRKNHPELNEEYLSNHIDMGKLDEYVSAIQEGINQEDLSYTEKDKLLYKGLISYIASGEVFDLKGKEFILRKGLEEKLSHSRAKKDSLSAVTDAFRDLYSMLKSGDTAQLMPDIAEAVATTYKMGFLEPMLDILTQYQLISEEDYNIVKHNIREKGLKSAQKAFKKIYEHSIPESPGQKPKKIAALIIGASGILITLLFSAARITGNVIGTARATSGMICGLLLILSAFLLINSK